MHGSFVTEMPKKISKDKTWKWLCKSDLKIRTEALLCAVRTVNAPCSDNVVKN